MYIYVEQSPGDLFFYYFNCENNVIRKKKLLPLSRKTNNYYLKREG